MADSIPGDASSTQPIEVGSSKLDEIETAGDVDWWRATLLAGYSYQIELRGGASANGTLVDPLLRVYDAGSQLLASNNDESPSSLDAYLGFTPLATGTFFLAAAANDAGTGSYTLNLFRDAPASSATGASLAIDAVYDEDLGFHGDLADWVAVSLTAGVEYVFDLVGAAYDGELAGYMLADPYLQLRNAQGSLLRSDDDSGVGTNARIVFTPASSGTYYLDAQGFDESDSGSYRLVANRAVRAGALTLGQAVNASLLHDGDTRWYSVNLVAGKAYLIAANGSGLADPLVELLYPDGTVYDYDDDSGPGFNAQLGLVAPSTGSYLVAVRGSGQAGTGSFTLLAQQVPQLKITDAVAVEGNGATSQILFDLNLSEASSQAISFTLSTDPTHAGTSASFGGTQPDVQARSQTFTLSPGQTHASFAVTIVGDARAEGPEAFFVVAQDLSGVYAPGEAALGLILDDDVALPVTDPLLILQWQLYPVHGIDVLPLWSQYRGQGVRVVVFDQGVDASNPDLQANVATSQGRNAADLGNGGSPLTAGDNHGTAVAGVIAAAADGSGLVGVAPQAQIVSVYSPMALDAGFAASVTNALVYARGFEVLNNSWGTGNLLLTDTNYAFVDDFAKPAWQAAGAALKALADEGRQGLGTVVVQSAGNAFGYGDDTNLHNFQNSRYVITVAATAMDGGVASYSTGGASVLVAAPGGDGDSSYSKLVSTDRSGSAGLDSGNTTFVSGTSFSSPLVAGIVALMLQANPRLGWRDVQEILARSARLTDSEHQDWANNGARDVNGGGMHIDTLTQELGFGLVDARAAVRMAETWNLGSRVAHTSANLVERSITHTPALAIPDDGLNSSAGGAIDAIHVTQDLRVERAEVTLAVTHPWVGDLYVTLSSPAGTTSFLISRPASGALSAFGSSQSDIHFTLDSVLDWGESALGDWTLGVFDVAKGQVGQLDAWTLTLVGAPASDDTHLSYTDEFLGLAQAEPARASLADSAGIDTFDAAALSSDILLDLSGVTSSRIGTQALTLATGTLIEVAIGGDGNDTLIGNAADNRLHGGRGNDVLDGGDGKDVASYLGPAAVDADLQRGTALQTGSAGAETDQLIRIEALFGSSAADTLRGLDGSPEQRGETLRGGAGNDTLDGRAGVDTAEYLGPRERYTVTRTGADGLSVVDLSGAEGSDVLSGIERLVFADKLLAFGARAEDVARVAFVLWTPEIYSVAGAPTLWARGLSFYDVGYSFSRLCEVALMFWPETGDAFAQKLLDGTPGTTRSKADVLKIMSDAGGGDAGRAAAVSAMALDPATTANLSAKGVFLSGLTADLAVEGFGTLFALIDGG